MTIKEFPEDAAREVDRLNIQMVCADRHGAGILVRIGRQEFNIRPGEKGGLEIRSDEDLAVLPTGTSSVVVRGEGEWD